MNTPTHPLPVHAAHAASGNVAGLFQARCSCGWRGLIVDETSASSAAVAHAATFGSESPLEHALRDGGDEYAHPEGA